MKTLAVWCGVASMILAVVGGCVIVRATSQAAQPAGADLARTVSDLDTAMFDALNRCQLEKASTYVAEDLEFYHDNGGLVHRDRQNFLNAVKNNLCGKVRRELVAATSEVYPMNGYGAVQLGVHRFHHPGREHLDGVGEAKFIHLWRNSNGRWELTRVISYDHHAVKK